MFTPPDSSLWLRRKPLIFSVIKCILINSGSADQLTPPSVDLWSTTSGSVPAGAKIFFWSYYIDQPFLGPPLLSTSIPWIRLFWYCSWWKCSSYFRSCHKHCWSQSTAPPFVDFVKPAKSSTFDADVLGAAQTT